MAGRRSSTLVPAGGPLLAQRRGSRATLWIMAIMLFLTVLASALGLATGRASRLLDRQLAGRLTVQVIDADAAGRDAAVARVLAVATADPAVARAVAVDRAHLADLVRPWLGSDATDPDLPLPGMVDIDLASADDAALAHVARRIAAAAPAARVDQAERWMSPVARVMALVTGFAVGVVLLMATATAIVVLLTTRLGLDTHRDTLAVLHNLGSTDVQVARLFQRRVAIDTLVGGVIGLVAAVAVLLVFAAQFGLLGSELVSGLSLGARDWLVLATLPFLFAALAALAARLAVLSTLRRVL